MRWRGLITAATALLVAAPAAEAAFPGKNGRIAFDDYRLFTVRGDGSHGKRLGTGEHPSFAAGGRFIAFAKDGRIWASWANGKGQRRLTSGPDSEPAFSPDGRRIVFSADRIPEPGLCDPNFGCPYSPGIYIMSSNGTRERNLTEPTSRLVEPRSDTSPTFTPDGRWIIFERSGDLWRMRPDGSNQQPLTRTENVSESSPDVSPNGKRIVFWVHRFNDDAIATIRRDGSGRRRVTRTRTYTAPVFSPNGRRIAYADDPSARPPGNPELLTIRRDGTDRRQLTRGRLVANPSWGPRP